MRILNCEFIPKMALVTSEEYRTPEYEIISQENKSIVLKIYSSIASGIRYTTGSAEIIDGVIHLFSETLANETIEFELLPWELTYKITDCEKIKLNTIFFNKEKASRSLNK